ncbi:transcriptional regulator, TetR family [Actinacidiphila alni]|uniref:Transcriptional regulator, TetR family n=1 Tax=Actinacidiphila alni TaxID=380248 RepID=A0A1I1X919_9ACTN|nr:TetR/AcrR family transcriptional regulator [Actinacidiphila alni]SFE03916.1 transcriptional regulator, TetR family [Actinacidiphila alni]
MGLVTDRAPKQDRSRATRQRILEAAVSCLAEHGWSGSTVAVVCARAGVSRGAAQHHFRTREELFTAAIAHMAEQWLGTVRERARALPDSGGDRTYAVVDMLVTVHTGPLFRAALHLWVAAADEEQLRPGVGALEARIGREAHRLAVEFLGADESVPGVRETVQATLDMARGLGLANLLSDDSARRAGIVRQWSRILDTALRGSVQGGVGGSGRQPGEADPEPGALG